MPGGYSMLYNPQGREGRKGHSFHLKANGLIMASRHFRKGLDNRQRDSDGEIRHKRGDTQVKTLRKEYGDHFLPGFRSDTRLDTVLKKTGAESLHQLLKKK